MIVNGTRIIAQQLELNGPEVVHFNDNHYTELTPAPFTPAPVESKLYLDGQWSVKRYPDFTDEDFDVETDTSGWESIYQPGKVFYADPLAEGEDTPNWNRVTLSHIDDDDGAVMRREIHIPDDWEGKKIFLRFDAIYPAGTIYLNGEKLGNHFSGLTPVEFNVSELVTPGRTAHIAVRLRRKHKFLKMDMVRHALEFAGLAQSAYFFAVEPMYIQEYHLISSLNDDFTKGTVSGTVKLHGPSEGELIAALQNEEGEFISRQVITLREDQHKVEIKLEIENPRLWNDEHPNLYDVCLALEVDGESTVYEYHTGFRKLELSPEGPKLNGSFIKFRGVNHLTFHPEYGMYTPKEWLKKCLSLMKKANVNAIRTHFLSPPALVELCDEMGIYLLQELPIDWGTNYIHDPEWVGPALMRLEGGIRRDRHHPSIMVWSVGNENMPERAEVAADGWNHLQIYDDFCKILDPSRPTMFPPPGPANKIKGIFELRVGDVADIHYSFVLQKEFREKGRIVNPNSWEGDMVEITREQALERGWSGCWFSSEYGIFNAVPDNLNGPYLSMISDLNVDPLSGRNTMDVFVERLRDEWGNMRHDPTCLGGAYFPWLCSGSGDNPWGWVRWGEDANWGVVTANLLPKPEFWALRTLFAPVWFPDRVNWRDGDDVFRFEITNHYNDIDLSECTFRTQQNGGSRWISMLRQFRDVKISCAPGETVTVEIPIWRDAMQNALKDGSLGICRITMLDPHGFCPVTADILVLPKKLQQQDEHMPVGPDAIL